MRTKTEDLTREEKKKTVKQPQSCIKRNWNQPNAYFRATPEIVKKREHTTDFISMESLQDLRGTACAWTGSRLGLAEQEPRPPGEVNAVLLDKTPAEQHSTKIPAEQFFMYPCSFKKSSKRPHVIWCELPLLSACQTLPYPPLSICFLLFLKTFKSRRIAFCVGKKAFWIDWKWLPFGSLQANQ